MTIDRELRAMSALVAIVVLAGWLAYAQVRGDDHSRAARIDVELHLLDARVARIVDEQEDLLDARRGCLDVGCDARLDAAHRSLERERRVLRRRIHRLRIVR